MKKHYFFLLLLCILFASLPAKAGDEGLGFWVETAVVTSKAAKSADLLVYYERELKGPIGFYALAGVDTDGYRHGYAGLTYKVTGWLKVGAGIGREFNPSSTQRNYFAELNTDKYYGLYTYEGAGSGPWHKAILVYRATEKYNVGVMDQTFLGRGPRLEYNLTEKSQIVFAILRDRKAEKDDRHKFLAAMNFTF